LFNRDKVIADDAPSRKMFRKSSLNTIHESCNDSIYGITTPKSLIIEDLKMGVPLTSTLLSYIYTNFNETEKWDIILELNKIVSMHHSVGTVRNV